MNTCTTCGRHLRRKGHYCGTPCKTAAVLTASDHRKLAKRTYYVEQTRRHPPHLTPTPKE